LCEKHGCLASVRFYLSSPYPFRSCPPSHSFHPLARKSSDVDRPQPSTPLLRRHVLPWTQSRRCLGKMSHIVVGWLLVTVRFGLAGGVKAAMGAGMRVVYEKRPQCNLGASLTLAFGASSHRPFFMTSSKFASSLQATTLVQ